MNTKSLILIASIIGFALALTTTAPKVAATYTYNVHDPIAITSNAGFVIGSNGVTSGTGAIDDPWIIENWVISATSAHGIYIANTTDYFIVRNCLIENGGSNAISDKHGIYLSTAVNGRIENNIIDNCAYGIRVFLTSTSDNISNNTCERNLHGIGLASSSDNLTNNNCSNNIWNGIYMSSASYCNVTGNVCENNKNHGIDLNGSYDNLSGNLLAHNKYDFYLEGTTAAGCDHNIDNTNLVNGKPVIYLKDNSDLLINQDNNIGWLGFMRCDNINVENVTIENNGQGVFLAYTENSRVENCTFLNNYNTMYLDNVAYSSFIGNTCSNGYYGINIYASIYDNLINNTISNNSYYGIYVGVLTSQKACHDNFVNNTISSNAVGLNLASYTAATDFVSNVFSFNKQTITVSNNVENDNFRSNQFNNNIQTSRMITLVENQRVWDVGETVTFKASIFNIYTVQMGGCTTVTLSPNETSFTYADNGTGGILGTFIPTRTGIYSLTFNVVDENLNTATKRMLYFVGASTVTTRYYVRGGAATHGQPYGNGTDTHVLLLTAPTSAEMGSCSSWVQNSPDDIPNYPFVNLESINTYIWYKQTSAALGKLSAERYVTYGEATTVYASLPAATDYTLSNVSLAENWTTDYSQNWYWLSIKMHGTNPKWITFPDGHAATDASYVDFVGSIATTPIIKSISNIDNILLLSATEPVGDEDNATIVLNGTGSTDIVLENFNRPFIGYTTTINSDNTATIAANNLTGTTTITSVAMDITPSSGSIDVNINNWENSGTYYKKWTESGNAVGTAIHTIDNLKANTYYETRVDGTRFGIFKSNSIGQVTFTYTGGYSVKTFEILETTGSVVVTEKGEQTVANTLGWGFLAIGLLAICIPIIAVVGIMAALGGNFDNNILELIIAMVVLCVVGAIVLGALVGI
jgi:parallel beta-helix repeat protein